MVYAVRMHPAIPWTTPAWVVGVLSGLLALSLFACSPRSQERQVTQPKAEVAMPSSPVTVDDPQAGEREAMVRGSSAGLAFLYSSVATGPGPIQLTVMPSGAISSAQVRVTPISPALLAE